MWWECIDCGVRTYDLGIPASCGGCGGSSFSRVRDEVFAEEVPLDDFEPDEGEVLEAWLLTGLHWEHPHLRASGQGLSRVVE